MSHDNNMMIVDRSRSPDLAPSIAVFVETVLQHGKIGVGAGNIRIIDISSG